MNITFIKIYINQ